MWMFGLVLPLLAVTVGAVSVDDFYDCRSDEIPVMGDESYSPPIELSPAFTYYGGKYGTCYVSTNGIVQFQTTPTNNKDGLGKIPLENYIFIAPFFADLFGAGDNHASYCSATNSDLLNKAKEQIHSYTNCTCFEPKYLVIANWKNIGYFNEQSLTNTFQCVLATDGEMSFALFLYDTLEWSDANPASVGFNNGTLESFWEMPCSGTENITSLVTSSNVGEDGLWVFQINQDIVEPTCQTKGTCEKGMPYSCLIDNGKSCLCRNSSMDDEQSTCSPLPSPTEPPECSCPGKESTCSSLPSPTEPPECSCPGNAAEVFAPSTVLGLLLIVSILIMIMEQRRQIQAHRRQIHNLQQGATNQGFHDIDGRASERTEVAEGPNNREGNEGVEGTATTTL